MSYYYSLRENWGEPFIMTIDTTLSINKTYEMPSMINPNILVDFGDGSKYRVTSGSDPNLTHTYAADGSYQIKIYAKRLSFQHDITTNESTKKVSSIDQWGDIIWTACTRMFASCINMVGNWSDVPDLSECSSMNEMFSYCSSFNTELAGFDTSNITSMRRLFYFNEIYNQPVGFNTANVETMEEMFAYCYVFNQSVSSFDTSKVTNMSEMFDWCNAFNQSVSNFNTALVTDMSQMFGSCYVFDQSVSSFDTSNVTDFANMFYSNYVFNQSVANFNTSSATDMTGMFNRAYLFNQSVSHFTMNNVTSVRDMLRLCGDFDQNVSTWQIASLTDASDFLTGATSFSQFNYDLLLIGWHGTSHLNNVPLGVDANYTTGGQAESNRNALLADGWIITDNGGLP